MFASCILRITLVLFLSASCSWDGGSRASAQLSLNYSLKCDLHVPWVLPDCCLNVPRMLPERSLNFPWTFPECSLNVPWMFPECSLNVCKLYSASTLALFLSASCSWDGSSRASNSSRTVCSLNVPWMFPLIFPECSLNTEFYSWDTSFGLVNFRLRYSCLQVVFCVNLGFFC